MELIAVRLCEIFSPVQQRRALPATSRTSLTRHTTSVSAPQAIPPHPNKHDVTHPSYPSCATHSRGWNKTAEYCGCKLHVREAFRWVQLKTHKLVTIFIWNVLDPTLRRHVHNTCYSSPLSAIHSRSTPVS